jgi:hypothetical protein
MRNTLFFLSLAAGLAIACASSAGAVPISAAAVKEVAATTSPLQSAQYAETWSRRGGRIKCFREFVIGPYRCHWYPL